MGERNPCGRDESADLALCEAPEQDIKGASPPWRWAPKIKTTPAAKSQPTGADDPMLGSLLLLNRALRRSVPSTVLLEGLPLEGQGLTLPLLLAAAARAGLSARLVERHLDDIPDTSLPAILFLDKKRPCVLLQRREHGRLVVAMPGWGGGEQEVSREELLALYSGHALFAQPALQAEVSIDTELVLPGRSPGAATRPSWRLRWDRLLASTFRVLCLRDRQPAEDVV
jgi:hypothetical protein